MTTTLDIENDVLSAAEKLAKTKGVSTGKALSDLARRGLRDSDPSDLNPKVWTMNNGLPTLRSRGCVITDEDIHRIRDAENI